MHNKLKLIIAGVAGVLILSGCAVTSAKRAETYAQRHPDMSLARNIALHTSLTKEDGPLTDVDRASLSPELKGASDHELANALDTVGWTGLGIAHFNGFALPPGISPSVAAGLDLFGGLFMPSRLPHPAMRTQFLAWMPVSMAANEKEASQRMREILKEAFIKSLPDGYRYEERRVTIKPTFGSPFVEVYENIVGPGCPDAEGKECRLYFGSLMPARGTAPFWAPGAQGDAYIWRNWLDGSADYGSHANVNVIMSKPDNSFGKGDAPFFSAKKAEIYTKMSSHLPEWIYIYSPPTKDRNYPSIINAGHVHLFVK
jgi:hypothetical protein